MPRVASVFVSLFLVAPTLLTVAAPTAAEPSAAVRWNQALLDAVKATRASDVVTARALAVVHTAMFDAWACYDDKAIGTHVGTTWRRPTAERSPANKQAAASQAAYRTLLDLFPARAEALGQTLRGLGLDPANAAMDLATPIGLGNRVARIVLDARRHDGANQKGDLREGAYADWTGWHALNPPDKVVEPAPLPAALVGRRPGPASGPQLHRGAVRARTPVRPR